MRRRDLHRVELAIDTVFLHPVFAALVDCHLRFQRRIGREAGWRRRRLGQGLELGRLLRRERKRGTAPALRSSPALFAVFFCVLGIRSTQAGPRSRRRRMVSSVIPDTKL